METPFRPLDIHDATDEAALEAMAVLHEAWRSYRTARKARSRARAARIIARMRAATGLRQPRIASLLVVETYDDMRRLAEGTVEEYRATLGDETTQAARRAAREAAIRALLAELVPPDEPEPESSRRARRWRDDLERWDWLNRRVDGLARYLTAKRLGIGEGSVNVLKCRARQRR